MEVVIANVDVAAAAVAWQLHALAQYPKEQERLRVALRTDPSAAQSMVANFIRETARHYPAMGTIPRKFNPSKFFLLSIDYFANSCKV